LDPFSGRNLENLPIKCLSILFAHDCFLEKIRERVDKGIKWEEKRSNVLRLFAPPPQTKTQKIIQ
jgi:hypothetical protein